MSAGASRPRLTRRALEAAGGGVPEPPVRIVHMGVGAFHRAHQAWYTARSTDAADWGIAAFTGRSPEMALRLTPQDGLYTVVERGPHTDHLEVVGNVVSVIDGRRIDAFSAALSSPDTALLTLTVTEAAYLLKPDGRPDLCDPALAADVDVLRASLGTGRVPVAGAWPTTVLGRLLAGLDARRRAAGGPIAVVPCDNVPDNGGLLRRGILELAESCVPAATEWLTACVSFVSTSVDRITPRTNDQDGQKVAVTTGWEDAAPVVTEPFSDWTLAGEFPAGRPRWESAGARFVADIRPYESRKLFMLNGAHSLLAYAGLLRNHRTVAEAIADPFCRGAVEALWDEAQRQLPGSLDLAAYRSALLERFQNQRIAHPLEQIAADGPTKLRVRIAPVAERELARGRVATGCALVLAAWLTAMERGIVPHPAAAAPADLKQSMTGLEPLAAVSPPLARNPAFRDAVVGLAETLDISW